MLLAASTVLLGLTLGLSHASIPAFESTPSSFNNHGALRLDLDSPDSGYHGLVKENETLVEVTPQIRAIGAEVCSFRIANKHHGEAPFKIVLKEKGMAELRALRALNCEKRRNYKFDIEAVGCNESLSENATVHITVVDVNEYPPQFLQPAYVSTVDEGRLYEEVVRVEASDRDCSPKFGDVCNATVHITVVDVNEYPPQFLQPAYVSTVDEGRLYEEVVRVEASDRDCSPKFGDVCKYEILTADQPFIIDNEGAIRNTEPLDYERSHNYILSVVAYDCGMKQSAPAMVTVKVNRVCAPGWRGIPERVDYAAGVGSQPLLPSARLDLCDAPCILRNVRATLTLATDHIGKGCDRDTYGVRSQRKLCGASRDSVDLLPTPGPTTSWTASLSRDEGREADEIFEFDGVDSAAIVPSDVLEHTLAQKFTIGVWVKHRPRPRQDPHVKEHLLCAADDHKMNRHHYALFVRNCRLILLLRRDFSEGDPNIFRPAEWRWKLGQVCDDKWHHYAVQVDFPHVSLFVDGEEWHTDEKNPEVIDDWPLHPAKGVNTTLVVGACWQGSDNKTKHHFRGYLAGLSVLVGRNEKPDVLSCLRRCQEGIHVPSMDLLQPGTQLLTNSDLTEVRIDGDNRTNVETLLRRIGYGSENNPLPVPTVQSYVTVLPPPRPGITVNGTGYVAREYAEFRLGVRVFPDVLVTAGSAARLDACAVSVYPSLNPDHESLGLPGDALRRVPSITARVDRDGVVLSGADTSYNYQRLIHLIIYTNRKPAYYLDRVFKLTCSELSGRFASNEILEPAPGHVQLSPHHADLPEEYATAALREGNRSLGGASGSHAVTIVAAVCICFLLLMAVVGAARVRGAAKRRSSAGDELAAETEMAWDDSALAITVNPMERLTEHDPPQQSQQDEDVDDSGTSDSEDGSYRDDDLDTSDCENDCELSNNGRRRRHTSPHDLEWDHRDV
ncbi:Calsyntenin-1 [Habropoda laboriosa]|uniref:Calsyntenin-1 n=1 Tax=Habropoda laboriosa TaxID=597456 RepID=A0A0L7QR66_9HYME|nr:Calsyntenin-1 [Habropoda laboriosa]